MKLHFLINISSDTENLYGIRFFNSFFAESQPSLVTLFHICRLDSMDSSQGLMDMWETPGDDAGSRLTVGAKKALDRATRYLHSSNAEIEKVKTKTVKERYGKIKDILTEGSHGLYDAMILGRRATYALQWMFDRPGDEIAQGLIKDSALSCPLWICSEPEEGRKNVLLCVDGSESSLRAADHVGYVLKSTSHHKVTVFHVAASPTNSNGEILQKAVSILRGHGLEKRRIEEKQTWGISVANAIISEKNSGRYAAVAVGLHGDSGGMLGTLGLRGGTTSVLINKISKAALWCCP